VRDVNAVAFRVKGDATLLTDEHYEELVARVQTRREAFSSK